MLGVNFKSVSICYIQILAFDDNKKQLKESFYKAIEETWEKLGDDCFDPLVRSVGHCVDAVLEVKGYYESY